MGCIFLAEQDFGLIVFADWARELTRGDETFEHSNLIFLRRQCRLKFSRCIFRKEVVPIDPEALKRAAQSRDPTALLPNRIAAGRNVKPELAADAPLRCLNPLRHHGTKPYRTWVLSRCTVNVISNLAINE